MYNYLVHNDASVLFCFFHRNQIFKIYNEYITSTEHSARCWLFITTKKKNFKHKQIPKAINRSHFKKITSQFVTIKHLLHGGHCASRRGGRDTSQHFCSLRTLSDGGRKVKYNYKLI